MCSLILHPPLFALPQRHHFSGCLTSCPSFSLLGKFIGPCCANQSTWQAMSHADGSRESDEEPGPASLALVPFAVDHPISEHK